MKKGIKAGLITGACLLGSGLILAMGALACGANTSISFHDGELQVGSFLPEATNDFMVTNIGLKSEQGEAPLEAFEKVTIDTRSVDIVLEAGDGYGIQLRYQSPEKINYKVVGNELTVVQEKHSPHRSIKKTEGKVTITVPRESLLGDIKLEVDMGDVTIGDMEADTVRIDAGMGEVLVKQMTVQEIEVNSGMGDVDLKGVTSYDTVVNLGMGEALLEGTFEGDVIVSNGMGDIEIITSKPEIFYNYDLEKGMGTVDMNGRESMKNINQNNGAKYKIEASSGMGDIEVKTGN
ncbi:MAG: DUF4097 family beta strand repeat-containing protein [Cellulosilyticaceae bacterium]